MTLIYVGTYTEDSHGGAGEGIYVYRRDAASGALELVDIARGIANPSYLAFGPRGRFLYAVNERATGTVSAFAVDAASGRLRFLNAQPTHGADPCHLTATARHVLVANYTGGSVCVLPVRSDGSLDAACDFVAHHGHGINPARQAGPHVHAVKLDQTGKHAYVADLGLDRLFVYRFDQKRGMLEPHATPWIKMRPGAGPRMPVLSANRGYLVNELASTVAVLNLSRSRDLQVVPTLPADFSGSNTAADIQLAPSGRFAYASNRGHDSIAIFRRDLRTGRLRPAGHAPSGGKTPRSFAIDPAGRFLIVANQDSDCLVTLRIDARTGALAPSGPVTRVPAPVCVKFGMR